MTERTLEATIDHTTLRHIAAAVAHRLIDLTERGAEPKWATEERELREAERLFLKPLDNAFRALEAADRAVAELKRRR